MKDLVAGDTEGNIWFFKNIGTAKEPKLAAGVKMEAGGKVIKGVGIKVEKGADGNYRAVPNKKEVIGTYSKLHVTDWDGDGLLDVLVGQDSPGGQSNILFYRNVGTAKEPKLAEPAMLDILKQRMSRPSPYVVDWDGDGKQDVLLGTDANEVMFLKNNGTNEKPEFAAAEKIELPGFDPKCYRCRIAVVDWNNDGKLDLLVGTFFSEGQNKMGGNVWLFLRK
ncbi:MAG: VCBS repeat-containing protein [Planctomycetota bacterium]|nr:VCBS repeat-containing protein [Planctomycetota bacterium]